MSRFGNDTESFFWMISMRGVNCRSFWAISWRRGSLSFAARDFEATYTTRSLGITFGSLDEKVTLPEIEQPRPEGGFAASGSSAGLTG